MNPFKSFSEEIFQVTEENFESVALKMFRYQAEYNEVYKNYVQTLGVKVGNVSSLKEVPFLPISMFKTQKVVTGDWDQEVVFQSSGTTGQVNSKHYVYDVDLYLKNTEKIFEYFYGPLSDFHFLALLPSYLEREGSSLVLMAEYFIKRSGSKKSGFFLNDFESLLAQLKNINDGRKIVLLGVSFALLDLAEELSPNLSGVTVMETGGMKGRKKELVREELHSIYKDKFNIREVHSEYGMTELMSQAYSKGEGMFNTPPWMKVLLRDFNDPFDYHTVKNTGGINIIDLANIHSCAFIETQDIGRRIEGKGFEVIGRFDNSDIRGCNLMVI
ncbi:acyl transferase [Fulvivirga sediminis]|uniref:Acyl transferase n=1 Tax=Fulvivirga sediminis TaxID=2803949 RepID=A0A937F6N4_9BACT|nr:acyl transferase [Fulvivirga sediminis]MBL3655619.1 acyl transferase [Fulvivirga sediminis]